MKRLNPLETPLEGLVFIEASAGTGKTYTITTLYLRLLLERSLDVDRILVVTFTEAATEELRGRIRERLVQALDWLSRSDRSALKDKDPVLAALIARIQDPLAAMDALVDQLARMDEAAIYTIHGFCQRMLQDNAFDSGAPFEVDFITDETLLRHNAAADFWRRRVADASLDEAAWIQGTWDGPDKLLADLEPTLAMDDLKVLPAIDPLGLNATRNRLVELRAELRCEWQANADEVARVLRTSKELNKRSYSQWGIEQAIAGIQAVVDAPGLLSQLPEKFELLTTPKLEKSTKKGCTTPGMGLFDLCAEFAQLYDQWRVPRKALLLADARRELRDDLDRAKRRDRVLYFDDLLRRMAQALQGEGGDDLAKAIRKRYQVAMIDEFQDTDPQQYRIFRRVFAGPHDRGLLYCGDPKQAIYAFRGADVFTYMTAKDDTPEETRYTLKENWRSGTRLIKALNGLFSRPDAPFVFEPQIGYEKVDPSPGADDEPLLIDGAEPVPLQIRMLRLTAENATKRPEGFIAADRARKEAAAYCAERVAELLNLAGEDRATIGGKRLKPSDIALLVRSHGEGNQVQEALRRCNVASVVMSQDSVFAGEDAEELELVLSALADLHKDGLVRAALGTGLLGRDAATLASFAVDEAAWESMIARLHTYREAWIKHGFMVGFQGLLDGEGVPERLLARRDGERRLTNLLQLGELLQVASGEHPGMADLVTWLRQQRQAEARGDARRVRDDDRQLRLESDEGLVEVVTMHKSKGLEYPIVFVPFPWASYRARKKPPPLFHDREDRSPYVDFGSDDLQTHQALADIELLAERLRVVYVTVTRAAKLCVLCWGKVNGAEHSALAYLLHQDPSSTPEAPKSRMRTLGEEAIRSDLDDLCAAVPRCIDVAEVEPSTGVRWRGESIDRTGFGAAPFEIAVEPGPRWRVSSYSSLAAGGDAEHPDRDGPAAVARPDLSSGLADEEGEGDPVFDLAAGTQVGDLLHRVFETIDFPTAGGETLERHIADLLLRHGPVRGIATETGQVQTIATLVNRVLDTPLDEEQRIRLRDVEQGHRLSEMEFYFPIDALTPAAIAGALRDYPRYAKVAEGLSFNETRGLMRGFIDLVFRHRGRYYVVDYKSNRLGRALSDYARDSMAEAIRRHRYDLQYLLYTVALHRFLNQRLADYAYERHFGGVYYLFLRGMRPQEGPAFGVWADRPESTLVECLDALFAGEKEVA